MLVPVLGIESTNDIFPQHSLVRDLGADSIDFVELVYLIEQEFGVVLKMNELMGAGQDTAGLFQEDKLTSAGAALIHQNLPESSHRYRVGMTPVELFSELTVTDVSNMIGIKMKKSGDSSC